jgi:hypothetical protein
MSRLVHGLRALSKVRKHFVDLLDILEKAAERFRTEWEARPLTIKQRFVRWLLKD